MVHNPIYPGYIWRQAFDFPAGFFQPGDAARADFRRHAQDKEPVAETRTGDGIRIEGDRLFLELDEAQTLTMGKTSGKIVTNFVIERGGEDIPIGIVVTIPVAILPTRPEP